MEKVFGDIPIYWINLNSSIARKNNMEKQLVGTNNYRIEAVDGRDKEHYKKTYKVINAKNVFSTALNAVLCSHLKAIKQAYDGKLPYVIVMEDKCQFDFINFFNHSINDIIQLANNKDSTWDIIQLYSAPIYGKLKDYKIKGLQVYPRIGEYYSLNYLINYQGMQKLLNLMPTNGIDYFDLTKIQDISGFEPLIYSPVNTYIVNCPVFYTFAEKSTFQNYFSSKRLNERLKCKISNLQIQIDAKKLLEDFYAAKK